MLSAKTNTTCGDTQTRGITSLHRVTGPRGGFICRLRRTQGQLNVAKRGTRGCRARAETRGRAAQVSPSSIWRQMTAAVVVTVSTDSRAAQALFSSIQRSHNGSPLAAPIGCFIIDGGSLITAT